LYEGPKDNGCPDDSEESEKAQRALTAAENEVDSALKGLETKHAYSWPDGSLYKYIRIDGPVDISVLRQALAALLKPHPTVKVIDVCESSADSNPHKGCPYCPEWMKTLEEYFDHNCRG